MGLPQQISAFLFDLDGVLTDTARVHAAAWKEMFDSYLRARAEREHTPFVALTRSRTTSLCGRQAARGRHPSVSGLTRDRPPRGTSRGSAGREDGAGSGNRKNEIVLRRIRRDGVRAYPGSVAYARAVRDAGLRRAVVASSTNCRDVLVAAHIEDLFERRVDGLTAQQEQLAGKPAPDMFLAAAQALAVDPGGAAVFEDALAGVAAGRAGGFGFVIGVDRVGQAEQLFAHGADTVVSDLADLMSQPMINHPSFSIEPWCLRATELDLEVLGQTESVFALSNGHIGWRANLDEGEPHWLPGSYLNGVHELRTLPYAEPGYGYPESGQTIINVTNGKVIRLLVDDEPFDVTHGRLDAHEWCLDFRDGVLKRRTDWTSPAGCAVRVSSTRLVSLVHRSIGAIRYQVEALDRPMRVVVQSELVANEALPAPTGDPRAGPADTRR